MAQERGVGTGVPEGRVSRSTRTGRSCSGRTMSSAASCRANRSQPCLKSARSATATNASIRQVPAPLTARVETSLSLVTVTRQRRVDSERPVLQGDDRVGHRQRKAACRCAHARQVDGAWSRVRFDIVLALAGTCLNGDGELHSGDSGGRLNLPFAACEFHDGVGQLGHQGFV